MHIPHHKEAATAIAASLEADNLKQWGFVIFRCTYGSQEKWDRLLALVKQRTCEYFEVRDMPEVYEKAVWTVFEDPAGLDGADLVETSRRFSEWVRVGEGFREQQEQAGGPVNCPRYYFYLHLDEESLESVLDEEKARRWDGNYLKVVRADTILHD